MTLLGLSPLALGLLVAGAASVLYLLHHLRVRPQTIKVPTLIFWQTAVEETRARTLFDRFRHPKTWTFLVFIAALFAFAIADPETHRERVERRHDVLVLDLGASMTAPEESGSTRLAAAKEVLEESLSAVPLRDAVALIGAGAEPRVVVPFGSPRPWLRRELALMQAERGAGDLEEAVALARALVRGQARSRIMVVTDREPGELATLGAPGNEEQTIEVRVVGSPVDDQSIASIAYQGGLEVIVHGTSTGRERRVQVERQGRVLASAPIAPATSSGIVRVHLQDVEPDGTMVRVALEPPDRVPGNDAIVYRLPRGGTRSIYCEEGIPAPARILIESDPAFRIVAEPDEADLIVTPPEREGTALVDAGASIVVNTALFASPASRAPPSFPMETRALDPEAPGRILLRQGNAPLVRARPGTPPRLEVASALLNAGGPWLRSASGAAALLECLHAAAGLDPGGVVTKSGPDLELPLASRGPERLMSAATPVPIEGGSIHGLRAGALGAGTFAITAPGLEIEQSITLLPDRVSVREAAAVEEVPFAKRGSGLRMWEWLVLLGFAFVLVDAALHTKGRIP